MGVSRAVTSMARAGIVRAAEEVFVTRGVAGAEVGEIAKRAGLSLEAFYLFFGSKEAALKRVLEHWIERCASLYESPAAYDEFEDAGALLDFCLERDVQLYRFFWQTRATMRLLESCSGDHPQVGLQLRSKMHGRCREWLAYAQRERFLRADLDLDVASGLMSGAHERLATMVAASEARPPIEQWVALAHEAFVRAFGTQELVAALERRSRRTVPDLEELGIDHEPAPSSPRQIS